MSSSGWSDTSLDPRAPQLANWRLPTGWHWGSEGFLGDDRHFQEVIDALGRSLSLVTVPDPAHEAWLATEARLLAHYSHPAAEGDPRRGPGYLRRWIAGETVAARLQRQGPETVPSVLQILRRAGSALSYLHDQGVVHGALSADTTWLTPTGRLWILGWQWAVPVAHRPIGQVPARTWLPAEPEATPGLWTPTAQSDQWHLAALCWVALTGERCPSAGIPPIRLVAPQCPAQIATILDRALSEQPADRFPTVAALLRALDRSVGGRLIGAGGYTPSPASMTAPTDEDRVRWILGDEYEVVTRLGSGTFGAVWQVRDLALGRDVALKMLHADIAGNAGAIDHFQREARLAAQLAHPAIVPIYDWDARGGFAWYTMELAENGSLAERVLSHGALPLSEVAPQVDRLLDALAAAHAIDVIHRDLKPENILIDRYRQWRLGDFGIAKDTSRGAPTTGSGTPAFAAPEQLLGELQGPAVDCYALAAIVAYALTATLPYGEGPHRAVLARQLTAAPDLRGLDGPLAAWLEQGLAADAATRFADVAAMRQAWRVVVADLDPLPAGADALAR
jgi:serine/threonine protein kinase